MELGSLAPSQEVQGYEPLLGSNFLAVVGLSFKQAGAVPAALSSTEAKANYAPMLGIITLVIVVIVALLVRWVLKRKHQRLQRSAQERAQAGQAADRTTEEVLKDISVRTKKIKDESDNPAK
jgi:flagellar biosynthesis/type III secretory pathway M-ring protein FliF/YscJ